MIFAYPAFYGARKGYAWKTHDGHLIELFLADFETKIKEEFKEQHIYDQRRRLAAKAKKLGRQTLDEVATIVAPGTLLTWHRNLIRRNHTGSACRTPGRPATRQEIAALAVRMAEENRSWGYRRIQGALSNLGHDLAHNTVRNILKRHGIEPSPERARRTTWTEFLQIHWQQIVASDFFSTDCSKKSRLASLVILCFMKLSTHRVDVARTKGATDGPPMIQIVRKVTPEMERLCNQKCDHIPRSRTHCQYRRDSRVGKLEKLILPPASNHASKLNRHQRRDRLLNDSECEAA